MIIHHHFKNAILFKFWSTWSFINHFLYVGCLSKKDICSKFLEIFKILPLKSSKSSLYSINLFLIIGFWFSRFWIFICWWEIKRFGVNHVSGLKCDVTVSFFHRLLDLMFFLTFAFFDHHPYPRSEKLNEVEDYYKT